MLKIGRMVERIFGESYDRVLQVGLRRSTEGKVEFVVDNFGGFVEV